MINAGTNKIKIFKYEYQTIFDLKNTFPIYNINPLTSSKFNPP